MKLDWCIWLYFASNFLFIFLHKLIILSTICEINDFNYYQIHRLSFHPAFNRLTYVIRAKGATILYCALLVEIQDVQLLGSLLATRGHVLCVYW